MYNRLKFLSWIIIVQTLFLGLEAQAEFCEEITSENAGNARYQQIPTGENCSIMISRADDENVRRNYVFKSDGSFTVSTNFPGAGSDSANSNVKTFILLPRITEVKNFGIKSVSSKFIEITLATGTTVRINVASPQPKIENLEGFSYYETPVINKADYNNSNIVTIKPKNKFLAIDTGLAHGGSRFFLRTDKITGIPKEQFRASKVLDGDGFSCDLRNDFFMTYDWYNSKGEKVQGKEAPTDPRSKPEDQPSKRYPKIRFTGDAAVKSDSEILASLSTQPACRKVKFLVLDQSANTSLPAKVKPVEAARPTEVKSYSVPVNQ